MSVPPHRAVRSRRTWLNPQAMEDAAVRHFYETYGWSVGPSGNYRDAEAFVDLRPVLDGYRRRRDRRVRRLLRRGQGLLVDVGCGALPTAVDETGRGGAASGPPEGMRLLCCDLTEAALAGARRMLADRANYMRADVRRLPLADASVGALLCSHVLYHLGPENQVVALREIRRVLAPGGVALVVHSRGDAPLYRWVRRRASTAAPRSRRHERGAGLPPLPFHPIDVEYLRRGLAGQMQFELRVWSLLETEVTRALIRDNRAGRLLLWLASAVERLAPRVALPLCRYPMLVIRG